MLFHPGWIIMDIGKYGSLGFIMGFEGNREKGIYGVGRE